MADQSVHVLPSFFDSRHEMRDTCDAVTVIEVVRSHPNFEQTCHEASHHVNVVVDSPKEDRLVLYGYPVPQQHVACRSGLWGDLLWMVKMRVQPDRVIHFEHLA